MAAKIAQRVVEAALGSGGIPQDFKCQILSTRPVATRSSISKLSVSAATLAAMEAGLKRAGVEFIDENGGGPVVRPRKRQQKKLAVADFFPNTSAQSVQAPAALLFRSAIVCLRWLLQLMYPFYFYSSILQ